jgi:hypothetical protein
LCDIYSVDNAVYVLCDIYSVDNAVYVLCDIYSVDNAVYDCYTYVVAYLFCTSINNRGLFLAFVRVFSITVYGAVLYSVCTVLIIYMIHLHLK